MTPEQQAVVDRIMWLVDALGSTPAVRRHDAATAVRTAIEELAQQAAASQPLVPPSAMEYAAAKAIAVTKEWCRGWDDCRAMLAAPAGWKIVPVEPTPEMLAAWPSNRHGAGHEAAIYRAMLAASPAVQEAPAAEHAADVLGVSPSGPGSPLQPQAASAAIPDATYDHRDGWADVAEAIFALNEGAWYPNSMQVRALKLIFQGGPNV